MASDQQPAKASGLEAILLKPQIKPSKYSKDDARLLVLAKGAAYGVMETHIFAHYFLLDDNGYRTNVYAFHPKKEKDRQRLLTILSPHAIEGLAFTTLREDIVNEIVPKLNSCSGLMIIDPFNPTGREYGIQAYVREEIDNKGNKSLVRVDLSRAAVNIDELKEDADLEALRSSFNKIIHRHEPRNNHEIESLQLYFGFLGKYAWKRFSYSSNRIATALAKGGQDKNASHYRGKGLNETPLLNFSSIIRQDYLPYKKRHTVALHTGLNPALVIYPATPLTTEQSLFWELESALPTKEQTKGLDFKVDTLMSDSIKEKSGRKPPYQVIGCTEGMARIGNEDIAFTLEFGTYLPKNKGLKFIFNNLLPQDARELWAEVYALSIRAAKRQVDLYGGKATGKVNGLYNELFNPSDPKLKLFLAESGLFALDNICKSFRFYRASDK